MDGLILVLFGDGLRLLDRLLRLLCEFVESEHDLVSLKNFGAGKHRPLLINKCPQGAQVQLRGLVHLDLPGLGGGLFGQLHRQNSILIVGLHAFRVDR